MRPDFKKLITAFLTFALVVGSGVYIFSSYWASPAPESVIKISTRNPNGNGRTNTFVGEKSLSPTINTALDVPPPTDPNNFTQQLARGLAQKVVEINPAGPVSDKDGNPTLKP